MKQDTMRHAFRVAGSLVTAAFIASCDAGPPTDPDFGSGGITGDGVAPTIDVTAVGARGDTVDVNSPLTVNVSASDNLSLRSVNISVFVDTILITNVVDTFATATPTYAKQVTASLAGIAAGARIRVLAQSIDGTGTRSPFDSLNLIAIDTLRPVAAITAPVANRVYNRGDTIVIDVEASDSSGLARIAYDIFRLVTPVDTAAFRTDSTIFTSRVTNTRAQYRFGIPATTVAGTYLVRARAIDRSGNVTVSAFTAIIIRDSTKPVPTFAVPGMFNADTSITAGDTNLIVTARATDNVGLARIKFWAYSTRGNAALGRVDTLLRYDTVYAPVNIGTTPGTFRANLVDTTVSRRMNRPTAVPPTQTRDTMYIVARVTDESGNDSTITRRVFILPTPFTQDQAKPQLDDVVPAEGANITLGNNITVQARLRDNFGIARFSVVGIALRGDPAVGKVDTVIRYDSVFAPLNVGAQSQTFRPGLTDTTIARVMRPLAPNDTTSDTLRLVFRLTDRSGRDTVVVRKVNLLSGPTVRMATPINGAVTFPGGRVPVEINVHGPSRLVEIGYNVVSAVPAFNMQRKIDVTSAGRDSGVFLDTLQVPETFPAGGTFRIVPFARDAVNPNLTTFGDSATLVVQVPAIDRAGPLVFQTIPPRPEEGEELSVRASDPSGIKRIGFTLKDAQTGATLMTREDVFTAIAKDTIIRATITIPLTSLGHGYKLYSYAIDTLGNRGNNLPSGSTIPDSVRADTTRGVLSFGQTYRVASLNAANLAGDVAVDRQGNAFISNLNRNQLERWTLASKAFTAPVAVGSQPWGMTFNRNADTLFVANSGGTNISVLPVATLNESRIKTPNIVIYQVTQTAADTSITRYTGYDEISYSDRPQYIAMSSNNSLFYSTRPTANAEKGTIRRLDRKPGMANIEVEQIVTYITEAATPQVYSIFNVDSVKFNIASNTAVSDSIIVYDHMYGNESALIVRRGVNIGNVWAQMKLAGSDMDYCFSCAVESLGLTDTTFVSAAGNGTAVAFGEANVKGFVAGRVMIVQDTLSVLPAPADPFYPPGDIRGSRSISVQDLLDNASDFVFGLSVDSLGTSVAANGSQTFFADLNRSALYNLRLSGTYKTNLAGAGVAYHPLYRENTPDTLTRVAFAAQGDTSIAVIDAYNYVLRQVIPVRASLYGPIRAVLPTAAEAAADPELSVKLYCLTRDGLLVIFVRKEDLRAG